MANESKAIQKHTEWQGKIEVISRAPVGTKEELAIAYTPGVAEPCLEIQKDVDLSYKYTRRHNLVAVVTDGTAVLGLGDIGPEAGMPVMEGKCARIFPHPDALRSRGSSRRDLTLISRSSMMTSTELQSLHWQVSPMHSRS